MKAVAIGLGLAVTVGAGWYLVSRGEDPADEDVEADTADEPERRRAPRERARDDFQPRRDGSLEERVVRLEDEVAMLRRQLALRGRTTVSSGSADVETIVGDPVLDQQVREIFEDEREREREERNERRAERFEEFRTQALDELVRVAGLSEQERSSIDELWATEAERMTPLINEARSGERSFRDIRDEVEAIRKETDDAVAAMLSETQLESYQELRPRGPGDRRGGGRRGGGRGGRDRGEG